WLIRLYTPRGRFGHSRRLVYTAATRVCPCFAASLGRAGGRRARPRLAAKRNSSISTAGSIDWYAGGGFTNPPILPHAFLRIVGRIGLMHGSVIADNKRQGSPSGTFPRGRGLRIKETSPMVRSIWKRTLVTTLAWAGLAWAQPPLPSTSPTAKVPS